MNEPNILDPINMLNNIMSHTKYKNQKLVDEKMKSEAHILKTFAVLTYSAV